MFGFKHKKHKVEATVLNPASGKITDQETERKVVNDVVYSLACPNCGAAMELTSGQSVFMCPYCKTKMYVYGEGDLELIGMCFPVPRMHRYLDIPSEEDIVMKEQVKNHAAQHLAKQLIEKGYVKIDKLPHNPCICDNDHDTYRFSMKLLNPNKTKF